MYLKTPKRYTGRQRRRLFNLRWWWLYLLTPIVVVIGAGIYDQRDMFRKPLEDALFRQIASAESQVATLRAPTATPTESPFSYLEIADAAYERGAMDEAIANYRLAAAGLPNDVDVHFRLAHLLTTTGHGAEAIELAGQAVNANPYDPLAWAIQGMVYEWQGNIEQALPSLYQALKLDPQNAVALSFLAEAYIDMGKPAEAREAADQALELNPTDYNVQRNYGYVAEYTGDLESAVQAYERARQLAPMQSYIVFNLADLYIRQGDYDTAVRLLRDVLDRNPENAEAYAALSRVLLTYVGEQDQAREAAERCIAIAPNNIACLSILGALQRAAGEFNLCARTLDRAIAAGSTNALTYYYGGTCYIVIGDCTRAREILLEGLALATTTTTQTDIRDALAQCQVVVTLVPTETPEGSEDGLLTATPEPGS